MKIKDSTIITLLIFTALCTVISVCGADAEITRLENQIAEVYGQQEQMINMSQSLIYYDRIQDKRMEQIEADNRIQDIRLQLHREELDDSAAMFTDLLSSMERLEEHMRSLPDNVLGVNVSDEDVRDVAALVYLEAGSQSYRCQKAIASVIFNRMLKYGMTAQQVIHQSGVFSPAGRVDRTTPSTSCMMAVREVLEEGTTLPRNVVAFRNGHYHSFGRNYCCIDGVYFSAV